MRTRAKGAEPVGGPRIWNRADIEVVMQYAGIRGPERGKVHDIMGFCETTLRIPVERVPQRGGPPRAAKRARRGGPPKRSES